MRFLRWILPFLGYVISAAGLDAATGKLAALNAEVPDLLPLNGFPMSYAEAFERLTGPAAAVYLDALWKYDFLLPLSYGALLFQLASRSGRWRYAGPVAMTLDFAQNVVAVMILRGGFNLVELYAALDESKFFMIGVAILACVGSFIVWAMERAAQRVIIGS